MFLFKKLSIIINIHGIASLDLIGFFFFLKERKFSMFGIKKAESIVK